MDKLTRKDLEDASMFTIFWAHTDWAAQVENNGMSLEQVIESDEGGPTDTGAIEQLELRKIDIGLHVERDDELCQGTDYDDLDAALAYVRFHEKPIIKVPDKLTSPSDLYKFYVVERMGW